jgi:hypothetical protein
MPDATYLRGENDYRMVAGAAYSTNELIQLPDGSAGVLKGQSGVASGDAAAFETRGQFTMTKTAGIVFLSGGRAYWDHSANAVHFKKVNDRDFYIGQIVGDAASADTTCVVNLNVVEPYDIDINRDPVLSVPTGTQAVGGFGHVKPFGGARSLELTATNEAQCIDLLGVDMFATTARPIVEAIIRVPTNGSTSAVDFNIGIANGTSTTDADAVTQHCFFHIDGADLKIYAQSKDGTTTVAATDTTTVFVAGSAVTNKRELWIDARDTTSVKLYVEGVRVLSATTFKLDAATGPLTVLAHLEKTASVATGQFIVDKLCARFNQQA